MHLMQQTNIAEKFQETGDVGIGILLLIDSPTWSAQFVVAAKYEGDLSGEAKWEDQNQTCGNNKLFLSLFPSNSNWSNTIHALKAFSWGPKLGNNIDGEIRQQTEFARWFFGFKENFLQQGGGGVKIPVPGLLKSGIQKISLIYGSIFYQLSNHLYIMAKYNILTIIHSRCGNEFGRITVFLKFSS